jgi:hypothetical protein
MFDVLSRRMIRQNTLLARKRQTLPSLAFQEAGERTKTKPMFNLCRAIRGQA